MIDKYMLPTDYPFKKTLSIYAKRLGILIAVALATFMIQIAILFPVRVDYYLFAITVLGFILIIIGLKKYVERHELYKSRVNLNKMTIHPNAVARPNRIKKKMAEKNEDLSLGDIQELISSMIAEKNVDFLLGNVSKLSLEQQKREVLPYKIITLSKLADNIELTEDVAKSPIYQKILNDLSELSPSESLEIIYALLDHCSAIAQADNQQQNYGDMPTAY